MTSLTVTATRFFPWVSSTVCDSGMLYTVDNMIRITLIIYMSVIAKSSHLHCEAISTIQVRYLKILSLPFFEINRICREQCLKRKKFISVSSFVLGICFFYDLGLFYYAFRLSIIFEPMGLHASQTTKSWGEMCVRLNGHISEYRKSKRCFPLSYFIIAIIYFHCANKCVNC